MLKCRHFCGLCYCIFTRNSAQL